MVKAICGCLVTFKILRIVAAEGKDILNACILHLRDGFLYGIFCISNAGKVGKGRSAHSDYLLCDLNCVYFRSSACAIGDAHEVRF